MPAIQAQYFLIVDLLISASFLIYFAFFYILHFLLEVFFFFPVCFLFSSTESDSSVLSLDNCSINTCAKRDSSLSFAVRLLMKSCLNPDMFEAICLLWCQVFFGPRPESCQFWLLYLTPLSQILVEMKLLSELQRVPQLVRLPVQLSVCVDLVVHTGSKIPSVVPIVLTLVW